MFWPKRDESEPIEKLANTSASLSTPVSNLTQVLAALESFLMEFCRLGSTHFSFTEEEGAVCRFLMGKTTSRCDLANPMAL